jgi:O-antigen ligase
VSAVAAVVGFGAIILRDVGSESGAVTRLKEAFSSEDERTIQKPYLIDAFAQAPLLGSGFGGYAGYQRNEEKPWTYELTYHTMLFNLGIVGTGLLLALFSVYFASVIKLLRRFKSQSAVPFGLLVGVCCLLLGAYSNPYLGGFDALFFVGLLPYLSTFESGFDRFASAPGDGL